MIGPFEIVGVFWGNGNVAANYYNTASGFVNTKKIRNSVKW